MYSEAINVAGTSHVLLSNRSAAYAKAGMWKEALEDADSCISLNEKFDKGKSSYIMHPCFLDMFFIDPFDQ